MGWELDCGYAPAYEHEEGHLVTVLDDGTEAGGWWPEIAARIAGWYIACSCGWRDDAFWPRDPADEIGHPPDELDRDEHGALYRTWRAHLDEAVPELAVHELRTEESWQRTCLGAAVLRARDAGVSWSRIGDAAGMSRQSAQERWGGIDETPARLPHPEPSPSEANHAAQQARRRANARLLRSAADALERAEPRDPAAWLRQRADTITFGQQSI